MDFKGATSLFADPDFDGDPVQIYNPEPTEPPVPPDPDDSGPDSGPFPPPSGPGSTKYHVDKVPVKIIRERVQYVDGNGQLITESIRDYTRTQVRKQYALMDDFINRWSAADQKRAIVQELEQKGIPLDALQSAVGRDYDPFDLILHVAYDAAPLTRQERAARIRKKNYFTRYGAEARAVMEALLTKYADQGLDAIESPEALKIVPFPQIGTPVEIITAFGGRKEFQSALRDFKTQLYATA
jgi:type I restriction enzyme R subunit